VKRKSIYLLLCIILVFSLVTACGDKQATNHQGQVTILTARKCIPLILLFIQALAPMRIKL